jgi:aerobic-type carbon monoxide dehydrogenase small subunit (CoxS/CutS family)
VKDVHPVRITVNGAEHELTVEARRTLADVLRHDLGYTGTHVGCEHGICGACTVLVDGLPARSCLMFGVQADGRSVETVEGLGTPDALGDLQQAFTDQHGLQCGFCTPGFLMLITAFLRERPSPTDDEIRDVVASNLCRCTGYQGILRAVRAAAHRAAAADG